MFFCSDLFNKDIFVLLVLPLQKFYMKTHPKKIKQSHPNICFLHILLKSFCHLLSPKEKPCCHAPEEQRIWSVVSIIMYNSHRVFIQKMNSSFFEEKNKHYTKEEGFCTTCLSIVSKESFFVFFLKKKLCRHGLRS